MVKKMKRYFFIIICVAFLFCAAYWAGGRVATQKCDTRIAEIRANQQSINIQQMVNANEKTVNTGVCDIRRILRKQYTIAE